MNELTEHEKLIEGINQMATLVSGYYLALIEKGVSASLAKTLAINYQNSLMSLIKNNNANTNPDRFC